MSLGWNNGLMWRQHSRIQKLTEVSTAMYSWKPQLTVAMEASTSTENGNFHVIPWKLPQNSHVLPASTNSHGSKSTFINFNGNFHGNKSTPTEFHGSKFTSREVSMEFSKYNFRFPWKLVENSMEVDRTEVGGPSWKSCESRWKFEILVEVGGSM